MPDTSVRNDIELADLAPAEPEAHAEVVKPVIDDSQASPPTITRKAFLSLLAQHTSSSWTARTCEFAFYLFLVAAFPDTLLLAAVYGFITTGCSVLFSGYVGSLVDRFPRLYIVRCFVTVQKISICLACAAFLGLSINIGISANYRSAPVTAWVAIACIVVGGCFLTLSNVGISVAIERDWVTEIAKGQPDGTLTRLNTWIRRTDLITKLLAPLFISLLTTAVSYTFAIAFTMGFAGLTLVFELYWLQVVFRQFPALAEGDKHRITRNNATRAPHNRALLVSVLQRFSAGPKDWLEFAKMPVFPSVVAISLLYLTVLSFDGTMLSYLKSRSYGDAFIAGQRGICVVTGLLGTLVMPWMEKKIGLIRAGAWSIVSELLCLAPVLATFYIAMPPISGGPVWAEVLLFGGMAASRIGLWAFDLCQLQELQIALSEHPRRNRFMGLQFSLQSVADLSKYVMVIVLSQPSQFRWAALVSFIAVGLGVVAYTVYVKRERGHVLHFEKVPFLRKGV